MHSEKTLIAIPIFNETDVCGIVQKVKKFSGNVLVVDDGSTYGLRKDLIGVENIQVIIHPKNLGYGKTLIDAFTFAINNGFDYLVTIDGDGQHEPEEIPQFLNEIPFCDYDILSGSRYLLPTQTGDKFPQERYQINKEITAMVNRVTGFNLSDAFCGFKAYKVEKLKRLRLTESGYGMPLQLWIQAWKSGLRVREIPVKLIYKDLAKQFSGALKDHDTRLRYYKNIIEEELSHIEP